MELILKHISNTLDGKKYNIANNVAKAIFNLYS